MGKVVNIAGHELADHESFFLADEIGVAVVGADETVIEPGEALLVLFVTEDAVDII